MMSIFLKKIGIYFTNYIHLKLDYLSRQIFFVLFGDGAFVLLFF